MNKKLIVVLIPVIIIVAIVISIIQNPTAQPESSTKPLPSTAIKKTSLPQQTKQSNLQKIKNIVIPSEKQKSAEEVTKSEEARQAELKAQKLVQWALDNAQLTPEQKRQKIVNLTVQARTLVKKGASQKAIDMAEELLFLDPENKEAPKLIEKANSVH